MGDDRTAPIIDKKISQHSLCPGLQSDPLKAHEFSPAVLQCGQVYWPGNRVLSGRSAQGQPELRQLGSGTYT